MDFERVLAAFLANDNAARKQAEAAIAEVRKTPDTIVTYLAQYMRQSQSPEVRSLAAVLLRRMCNSGDSHEATATTTQLCSPQVQAGARNEVIAAIDAEPLAPVRRQCADTAAALATLFLGDNQWPELLPQTLAWSQRPEAHFREIAMHILSRLAEFSPETMSQHAQAFHQLVQQGLGDAELSVRCVAMKACIAFVIPLSDSQVGPFEALLPQMLAVIAESLNAGKEEVAEQAIDALSDVAREKPKFVRSMFGPITQAMIQIGLETKLESKVRSVATTCFITMAEHGKAKVRDAGFISRAIELIFRLLVEVEDDDQWLQSASDDIDPDDPFYLGLEAAHTLSMAIGGKAFLPPFCAALPQLTGSADWKQRHAAIMAISQIGESCAKQLKTELGGVLQMVLPFMSDQHPRVVFSALQLVGVYCSDLAPDFQSTHHAAVLPAIIAGTQSPHLRIKAQAAAALVNFCAECEPDTLDPYVDGLLTGLVPLLQLDSQQVQEDAVTALSQIASHCSRGVFAKYYDAFIPGLRAIVERNAGAKDAAELQGKALECMSLIGLAAGKERFAADACQMMQVVLKTLTSKESLTGDPVCEYMLKTVPRICEALGEDFVPFLPQIMPMLLRSLNVDTKYGIEDADESSAQVEQGLFSHTVGLRGQGQKRVTVHIEALSEKLVAAEIVTNMCMHLGKHYFPYVAKTLEIMVPLLGFFMEDIRHAAIKSLPELMRCGIQHYEAQGQPVAEFAQGTARFMLPLVLQAVIQESDTECLSMLFENFAETIQVGGDNLFTPQEVATFIQVLRSIIDDMLTRRQEIEALVKDDEVDEKELEDMEVDLECEFELQQQVSELLGAIIRSSKGVAVASFDQHLKPLMGEMLDPARRDQDHMMALCAFDDMIEHGAPMPQVLQYAAQVTPSLLSFLCDKDTDVRQAAAYGLGICAAVCGTDFQATAPAAVENLNKLICHPEARSEENAATTDNAISAVGKVAFHHSTAVDTSTIVPAWLSMLPLKADRIEAKATTELIAKMVESRFEPLLANPSTSVPQILNILADSIDTGCTMIKPTILNLQQMVPGDVLQTALQSLDAASQQKLASCA